MVWVRSVFAGLSSCRNANLLVAKTSSTLGTGNRSIDASPSLASLPPSPSSIVLAGCGVVGREIARCHVDRKIGFHWIDADADALAHAANTWIGDGNSVQAVPWIDGLFRVEVRNDGSVRTGPPQFGNAPLVIESVVEDAEIKRVLFRKLDERFAGTCMLASNTSTLRIANLARPPYQDRLVGMHFFMPVTRREGVEVVAHDGSDPGIRDVVFSHAQRLGKQPFFAPDDAGFIVNRMLSPYLNECLWMACEGISASTMQKAAHAYGMPMSPFRLIDTIGLETTLRAGSCYVRAFPNAIEPCPVITRMVKLGRKAGKMPRILEHHSDAKSGSTSSPYSDAFSTAAADVFKRYARDRPRMSLVEIVERMRLPMRREAAALRDQHDVGDATIDTAIWGGLAFRRSPGWTAEERDSDFTVQSRIAETFGLAMPKPTSRSSNEPKL